MADRNGGYIGRAPGDSSVIVARQTNQPTSSTGTFVFNSGYDVGYLDVYINGSKLVNALDYQATDTQNVILTTPAENGDVVEFIAYKAFNLTQVITETSGDLTVDGSVTAVDGTFSGNVTAVSFIGDGSQLTGIVTSLTAGDNISLSGSTGSVTITGLANTSIINADSLNVTGITTVTTFNATTGTFTSGVNVTGVVTATSFSGSGQNLTNLPASGDSNDITACLFI